MTTDFHTYLTKILEAHKPSQDELEELREIFTEIKDNSLRQVQTQGARIYYGGSYAKKTMIADSYDLDMVIYYPSKSPCSPEGIFYEVNRILKSAGHRIEKPRGIALQFEHRGYSIDIIPAKAKDNTFIVANAYDIVRKKVKRTSLKEQIDYVRHVRPIIKLMKIWRKKHHLKWHKTAMDQIVVNILEGKSTNDYGKCLEAIFLDIMSSGDAVKFFDPTNSNNPIRVRESERKKVQQVAEHSYQAIKQGNYKKII